MVRELKSSILAPQIPTGTALCISAARTWWLPETFFSITSYQVIDIQKGGRFTCVLAALNRIIDITIPKDWQEGGTMVISGHGRIADDADVVEYRDMITIIRDRIQDMVKKGISLQQVQAARPTHDYDGRYGDPAAMIEAAYRELSGAH